MTRTSATEAAREMPLNDSHTIEADRWRELMTAAPSVDDGFFRAVMNGREEVGPPNGEWQS